MTIADDPGTGHDAGTDAGPDAGPDAASTAPAPWWIRLGVAAVVLIGVIARFLPRGDLWLDEALSANIAELGPSGIGAALRRDGHPPLYYWLLDAWSSVVGTSPWALRSLSGVIGVLTLPLMWLAGRRVIERQRESSGLDDVSLRRRATNTAVAALTITALLPFAVRYSSETRMYALVSLLVVAGYLVVSHHLERARWSTGIAAAVIAAALLWTHYWSIWLLGAVGLLLVATAVRAHRSGDRARRTAALGLIAALIVAGLVFLPWLGTMLYQGAHTGTPWGKPVRPATFAVLGLIYLAGGSVAEPQLVAYVFAGLILLGVAGTSNARGRVELGLRVRPNAQVEAAVVALTLAIAWVVSFATRSAFAPRYLAVVVPLVVLVAAVGLSAIRSDRWRRVVAVVLLAGFTIGIAAEVTRERTQAGSIADAVVESARGAAAPPLLFVCPDQDGPSIERALRNRGAAASVEIVTYHDLGDPRFVDWVDYAARNAAADPDRVTASALERAGSRPVLYAYTGNYTTLEGQCEAVLQSLATARGAPTVLVPPEERNEDEPAIELLRFDPR